LIACSLGAFGGCSKAPTASSEQKPADAASPAAAPAPIDVCALLNDEELEAIQGEMAQEKTPNARSEDGLAYSQCFFKLPTFPKSINISITQGSAPGPKSPREFWKSAFSEKNVQQRERADGRVKLVPERVEGIGAEAFWTGGPAGGLYVLRDDSLIFISIGSTGDEAQRRESVRRIAEIVLQRL
jgi:hypothetical protein